MMPLGRKTYRVFNNGRRNESEMRRDSNLRNSGKSNDFHVVEILFSHGIVVMQLRSVFLVHEKRPSVIHTRYMDSWMNDLVSDALFCFDDQVDFFILLSNMGSCADGMARNSVL
jgi:hypothetical protein